MERTRRSTKCLDAQDGITLVPDGVGPLLSRCLSLDLEVGVQDRRIHAFAGVRSDTGQTLTFPSKGNDLATTLARLDNLAVGADFLLGHNLIDFDLPHLQAANPELRLLKVPAVDTLRLNPLAFPRNPYHHLVKHYQDGGLRRGRINDPELDARLTVDVFADQLKAFAKAPSDLLLAWHWLTTVDGGRVSKGPFRICGRCQGRPTSRHTTLSELASPTTPAGPTPWR